LRLCGFAPVMSLLFELVYVFSEGPCDDQTARRLRHAARTRVSSMSTPTTLCADHVWAVLKFSNSAVE
jgi:hypothetical protein